MSGKRIFSKRVPDKEKLLNKKVFTSRGKKALTLILMIGCAAISFFEKSVGINRLLNNNSEVAIVIDNYSSAAFMGVMILLAISLVVTSFHDARYYPSDEIPKLICTRREIYEDRRYSDEKINNILIDYYRRFYDCSDEKISELIGVDICEYEDEDEDDSE